ncbi:MAG: PspC domain-containing protein [Flavobacteriales bacterium]
MNKAIGINLAGTVFYIDEDAFQRLKAYLASLKDNLGNAVGKEEIIADIEARMAELFQERLKKARKEAVSREDVDGIVDILGQPEDYVDEETTENTRQAYHPRSQERKLYRDPDRKVIAGVASGLAAYMGIHPLWVRISFIALSFLTLGSALAIYALLWISFPYAKTTSEKLEMRGEPVNFNTIKKNFSDTAERLKKNGDQNPTLFEKLAVHTGRLLLFILKAIGYFVLLVLLLVAAIAAGAIVLSAFGLLLWSWHIADFDFTLDIPENHFFLINRIPFAITLLIISIGLIFLIAKVAAGKKVADFVIPVSLLSLFILLIFALVRLWHIWCWIH